MHTHVVVTWVKCIPALYNLFLDGRMPEKFEIVGMGHGDMSDGAFRKRLQRGVARFSRRGKAEKGSWDDFASHIFFESAELKHKKVYETRQDDLRKVVVAGAELGIPVGAFMSALTYFDTYRSTALPANLIMAQRDCFGAHKWERIDAAGSFHTAWAP